MNNTKTAMRVAFLPVNQAWVVAFGQDGLIDLDDVRLWADRRDLVLALADKGLAVARDGSISVERSLAAQGGAR